MFKRLDGRLQLVNVSGNVPNLLIGKTAKITPGSNEIFHTKVLNLQA